MNGVHLRLAARPVDKLNQRPVAADTVQQTGPRGVRMTRVTATILTGAGVLTAMGLGAGQARKTPAFTAADQLKMARTLCGAATRGTAVDDISGSKETVSGFLSADGKTLYVELLSTDYEVHGTLRHALVFGGHYVEDGTIDSSEGAHTEVCAAVLEHRGGAWTPIAHRASLTETGFNGRDPGVALHTIGADRYVLQITQSLWNRGSSMTVVTLYEPESGATAGPNSGTFTELVSAATDADDCGAGERCFTYEGSLVYAAGTDPAAVKDLHLLLKGTYRNEAGRIIKIPAGPLVLRLTKDGTYAPVTATPATQALWTAVQSPWGG